MRGGVFGLVLGVGACDPRDGEKGRTSAVDEADRDGDGDPDATDCAPADPTVSHNAEDVCNGVDDDCDGEIDEGPAGYPDADGDGYGEADHWQTWCEAFVDVPLVPDGSDCNDRDASVHPAAADPFCDGVDQDCDGRGESFYFADDGQHFGGLASALEAAGDGQTITVCPGIHPTHAMLDRPISVVIEGETGDAADVELDGEGAGTILYVGRGAEVTLRDVSVVRGKGELWGGDLTVGGGLAVVEAAVVLESCVVRENDAEVGAGVYINQDPDADGGVASLIAVGSIFEDNTAVMNGGAVGVGGYYGVTSLVLEGGVFRGNVARRDAGGGIYLGGFGGLSLLVVETSFAENQAGLNGGALATGGYGDQALVLQRVSLEGNSSESDGGAVDIGGWGHQDVEFEGLWLEDNRSEASGGAVSLGGTGSVAARLDGVTFVANVAESGNGGALEISPREESTVFLLDTIFVENSAGGQGGALDVGSQGHLTLDIEGVAFVENRSGRDGAGVFLSPLGDCQAEFRDVDFSGNAAGTDGGAIGVAPSRDVGVQVDLHDVELVGNTAGRHGGAMALDGLGVGFADAVGLPVVTLNESVIDANSSGEFGGAVYLDGNRPGLYIQDSVVTRNLTGNSFACGVQIYGTGDVEATDVDWGAGSTANSRCDVGDDSRENYDLEGVEDLSCVAGHCSGG